MPFFILAIFPFAYSSFGLFRLPKHVLKEELDTFFWEHEKTVTTLATKRMNLQKTAYFI